MKLVPSPAETIVDVARMLRSGEKSCIELLEVCLTRIDEWEPKVRAWVRVDRDAALKMANDMDGELDAGNPRGPLHGIPIGVKDIVDVAGLPTAAGSRLSDRAVAKRDAELVKRLRAAGALILGKTVTTQFACFDPPETCNPWNLDRTPGGSSSGSAAAVATGMCLGAVGSQTGGSITRPASYCGVAGCKPSFGRVSVDRVLPVAASLDHPGPIARTVADLGLLLEAMSVSSKERLDVRLTSPLGIQPPRLGRLGGFFDDLAEASVLESLEKSLQHFGQSGASISSVSPTACFDDLIDCHRAIMAVELAAFHEQRLSEHPDDYLPLITGLIQEGLAVPAVEYVRSCQHQLQSKLEVVGYFDQIDVLVCPATLGPAPDRSSTGSPTFNAPWSYTGLPTISFPIGLDPEGLPLAIQLVGRANDEANLFGAAAWCEQAMRSELA